MEKKISFGFSKLQKKPQLIAVVPKNDDKVELIEGFEDQSVKIIGEYQANALDIIFKSKYFDKDASYHIRMDVM